jgi:RecA/RadA recombinase
MTEQDRRDAIRTRLARMDPAPRRAALATGFEALDAALGGLPRGRIVELYGPPCGKTTLALVIVARLQNNGSAAGWLDADRTFDPAYAARSGVALEQLPLVRPDSAEQGLEIARRLALSGALDLLVIDSAAALAPRLPTSSWVVATKYTSASCCIFLSFSAAESMMPTQARSSMVLQANLLFLSFVAGVLKVMWSPI